MSRKTKQLISSVTWNLLLIAAGAVIFSIGVKAVVLPHGLITGGISGVSLLCYYATGRLTPGQWYFVINVPLFLMGWKMVSRRFFFYSLFGAVASAVALDMIRLTFPIHDPFLAVLAGGVITGIGAGIVYHSLGSMGGNDIIAIVLHQRYNLRMGTYFLLFNLALFSFSFGSLSVDMVLYSIAMAFVTSQVIDTAMTMFNQRKMALIISDHSDEIAGDIHRRLNRGATFIEGVGTYTGQAKKIILTVVHNYQLKRLEEAVFSHDPDAFVITENTFNVYGRGFSRRKVY
ncbi:MAG: YitT family protein [Desulfobacterales bacterium]|jgi:uncharacterized membrane-anchored protein YitT (DUF2179 family)